MIATTVIRTLARRSETQLSLVTTAIVPKRESREVPLRSVVDYRLPWLKSSLGGKLAVGCRRGGKLGSW
jgi:hypothetical protein